MLFQAVKIYFFIVTVTYFFRKHDRINCYLENGTKP